MRWADENVDNSGVKHNIAGGLTTSTHSAWQVNKTVRGWTPCSFLLPHTFAHTDDTGWGEQTGWTVGQQGKYRGSRRHGKGETRMIPVGNMSLFHHGEEKIALPTRTSCALPITFMVIRDPLRPLVTFGLCDIFYLFV